MQVGDSEWSARTSISQTHQARVSRCCPLTILFSISFSNSSRSGFSANSSLWRKNQRLPSCKSSEAGFECGVEKRARKRGHGEWERPHPEGDTDGG